MNQPRQAPEAPNKQIVYKPIRKHLLQRLLLRWAILLAVAVAFVVLTAVAAPFCDETERGLMIGMTVAIYLYIFWKSRLLPRTFAKEWRGTVLAREPKKAMKMPRGIARPSDIRWTMVCKWTVQLDPTPAQKRRGEEGDVVELTFDTEEIWERYFAIGERVHRYKNARYIIKESPKPDDENLLCPLCNLVLIEPRCWRCRVDFSEDGPRAELGPRPDEPTQGDPEA